MKYVRFVIAFGLFVAVALQMTHDAARVDAAPVLPGNSARIHSLSQLPIPAQGIIAASLGRGDTAYHARPDAAGWRFENAANSANALFGAHGAVVQFGGAEWNMGLRAWGFENVLSATRIQPPTANANRVEYARGALTEWYVNGALGLQQGFTVNAPAHDSNAKVLTLAVALPRELRAELSADARSLVFYRNGAMLAQYFGLTVYDAQQRELDARFEIRNKNEKDETRTLVIRTDTRGAQFPVAAPVVDER